MTTALENHPDLTEADLAMINALCEVVLTERLTKTLLMVPGNETKNTKGRVECIRNPDFPNPTEAEQAFDALAIKLRQRN